MDNEDSPEMPSPQAPESALERVDKRLSDAARKRLAGAAAGKREASALNWQDALQRSEVLRARRIAELKAERLTQDSRESIPTEAGSYHPDRVALLVFEAMRHVGAGYFASRLNYLRGMSSLAAFLDTAPAPKAEPKARTKKRK